MTDIVEWLQRFKTLLIKSDASKPEGIAVARIAEAASEITRLRSLLRQISRSTDPEHGRRLARTECLQERERADRSGDDT